MLLYTADLKRPLHEPAANKHAAVQAMLLDLGLDVCQDTIIGDTLHRGISGGQVQLPIRLFTRALLRLYFTEQLMRIAPPA
jgi:hypothetical protein